MTLNSLILIALEALENRENANDCLARFAKIFDISAATIAVEDRQHRAASLPLTYGMDRSTIDSYTGYYVRRNPYALLRSTTSGEVRKDHELLSVAQFRETEFYQGWYKPNGWLHHFSVILDTTKTEYIYLVARRPENHPFTEAEMTLVKDFAPALAGFARSATREGALQEEIKRLRNGAGRIDPITKFNLTPTEARIALAMADGQTPKEIAYRLSIKISTVRSHEKSIYKKTGVNRQADLVRLLHRK